MVAEIGENGTMTMRGVPAADASAGRASFSAGEAPAPSGAGRPAADAGAAPAGAGGPERAGSAGAGGPGGVLAAGNADEALEAAVARARAGAATGLRACVVTASAEQAAAVRRRLAADGGALGVEALPWGLWLADRWELWGDGRRLAGEGERLVLAAAVLDEALGCEATPGRVALLADLVAEDLPALLDGERRGPGLAPDEERLLAAAARYADELAARGLAEPSEACALLAEALGGATAGALRGGDAEGSGSPCSAARSAADGKRPGDLGPAAAVAAEGARASGAARGIAGDDTRASGAARAAEAVIVLGMEADELSRPQAALLDALGATRVENGRATARPAPRAPELAALLDALYRPDPAHPVEPAGALRCAFPTGATVEGRLIADEALALAREAAAAAGDLAGLSSGGAAVAGEPSGDRVASAGGAAGVGGESAGSPAARIAAPGDAADSRGVARVAVPGAPLVAVAALDPEALFADYADELAAGGAAVALEASVPLGRTEAGRFLLALGDALGADEGRLAADAAADAALGAASGVWCGAAFGADRAWRRDRLTSPEAVCAGLGALDAEALAPAVDALAAGRLSQGVDALAAALLARARGEGERAAAAAALAPVLAAAPAAEAEGLSFSRLMALLSGRAVPLSLRVEPAPASDGAALAGADDAPAPDEAGVPRRADVPDGPAAPDVLASAPGAPDAPAGATLPRRVPAPAGRPAPPVILLTTLERAARLAPGAAHGLLVCGLNSAERPVRPEEGARRTLLAKLGAARPADALAVQRRRFRDAVEAARAAVVLERALNAVGAEPRYPATLFEEAVDCYRADLRSDAGMDRDLAIPEALVPFARTLAESRFVYGACGTDEQPAGLVAPLPPTGAIGEALAPFITLPRGPASVTREGLDLSPSAIESYLDCPYRWFLQRRLALEGPDEGFGSLERGTFVHEMLQSFYLRLREEGEPRVTEANRDRAVALLDAVFDEACASQALRKPGHRYVPLDRHERDLRAGLLPKLERYVAAEAAFLPGFVPTYLEWDYGRGGDVPYAGHWLTGTVDRIDVDAEGRAVVIDYKTSLGPVYHLHGRDEEPGGAFALPRRTQALVYARVAEQLLGVRVVAALYVNPLRQAVAGAFDGRSLDAAAVPGLDPERSRVPYGPVGSFAELLDRVEEEVARRLASLAAGDVRPAPSDKEACRWCSAVACERRL